jgi:predicted Zn-dependent protease
VLVAGVTSCWLLASREYAEGGVLAIARQTWASQLAFERSRALMPGVPLTAEAVAQTALQLAETERDAARRRDLLRRGDRALADARRYATPGASAWMLAGRLALAQARAGDASKRQESIAAFEAASRLRPRDPQVLALWALARLDGGDAAGAGQIAQRALEASRDHSAWLAWAVLARARRDLGDAAGAEQAAAEAERGTPPEARSTVDAILTR